MAIREEKSREELNDAYSIVREMIMSTKKAEFDMEIAKLKYARDSANQPDRGDGWPDYLLQRDRDRNRIDHLQWLRDFGQSDYPVRTLGQHDHRPEYDNQRNQC